MELQVRQGFDRSGRTRRTVVAVSGSGGEKEVIFRRKQRSQLDFGDVLKGNLTRNLSWSFITPN